MFCATQSRALQARYGRYFGVRREAKRHAALDDSTVASWSRELASLIGSAPKRRRRCALPAQSKGARVCDPQPSRQSDALGSIARVLKARACCGSQPRSRRRIKLRAVLARNEIWVPISAPGR